MPPSRRRRSKSDQQIAAALKTLGVNVDGKQSPGGVLRAHNPYGAGDAYQAETDKERYERVANELLMAEERVQLEAESVLFYIKTRGKGFKDKECKQCGNPFASTYVAVDYCSSVCRFKSLAEAGIVWNPYGKTDLERWGGRIPKVLGPQALIAAMEVVENLPPEPDEEVVDEVVDLDAEDASVRLQEMRAKFLEPEEDS